MYTRATDGSPAVRLGDGHPESLSPDGKWVLTRAPGAETAWGREWVLVPTGPGTPRLLPRGTITQLVNGAWLPDGKRIVFTAIEGGQGARGYVQDVDTGSMRPITPAGVHLPEKAATPDGKSVLVRLDRKWFLYPIDGGQPRPFRYSALTIIRDGGVPTDVSSTSCAAALFLRSPSSDSTSRRDAASRGRHSPRPIRSASSFSMRS